MKIKCAHAVLAIAAGAILPAFPAGCRRQHAPDDSAVVARVGKAGITVGELREAARRRGGGRPDAFDDIEQRNALLREMIRFEAAAMTAKNTNSDVRVAIKTLYLSALEPKVPLRDHFEKARRDIMFDVVKDLNDKGLLILKAVRACPDGLAKHVYQVYQKVSSECHEESLSYMAFYSTLSYLQSLGLVVLLSTKVNRTYTNRIQLTFDSSILLTVLQMRFA